MIFQNLFLLTLSTIEVCLSIIFGRMHSFTKGIIKISNPDLSNSILIIRTDHKIGDMTIFSDFLKKLHLEKQGKSISLIIHSSQKDLYINCPYVDKLYYFDWGRSLPLSLPFRSIRVLLFLIRNKLIGNWHLGVASRYDEDFYAPFILYLSKAKIRVGYTSSLKKSRKRFSMFLTDIFYNKILGAHDIMHEAESNLLILKELGINYDKKIKYETWQCFEDDLNVKSLLRENNIDSNSTIITLGIGAFSEKRIWPPEFYARLISLLSNLNVVNIKFILMGSKSDSSIAESILKHLPLKNKPAVIDVTGKTTIMQSCALLALSKIFIGNDSGLMHLACANTGHVIEISCHPLSSDISHSNSPARFGPISEFAKVFQPQESLYPCINGCSSSISHCITGIQPETILNYVRTQLETYK